MKLLELYASANGAHKFVTAEGTRRTDLTFTSDNTDAMLAHALRLIESDSDFEPKLRIYDAFGKVIKGNVTMWVSLDRLKSWARHDREPLAA